MKQAIRWAVLIFLTAAILSAQNNGTLAAAARRLAGVRLTTPGQTKSFVNTSPRLDANLQELSDGIAAKSIQPRRALVAVDLVAANSSSVAGLRSQVARLGGRVTGSFEDTVFASIPASAIRPLSNTAGLFRMNVQPVAHPDQDVFEKGIDLAGALGATALHAAGIRGRGVRIGIIDFGFARYDEYVASGKLPRPTASRAFNSSNRMEGDNEVHGTGCAEIIHTMAPDAELVLATISGTQAELFTAAQWMVSQKVQIISFSAGYFVGPHNGQSPQDRLVESLVRSNHILWVNSAGNSAATHWMGDASRRDREGWIRIGREHGEKLFLRATANKMSIDVVWDDWGRDPRRPVATQGVDAYLFTADSAGSALRPAGSRIFDGRGTSPPVASFEGSVTKGQVFVLGLRADSIRHPVRVHVFTTGFEQLDSVPEGSVVLPATSNLSLTVGAVNVRTMDIEDFSSRGPTDDGRQKPDISAYDGIPVAVYPSGFAGTSASCPHAAGFAALVAQARPGLTGEGLRQAMLELVRRPRPGAPAAVFGSGIIEPARLISQLPGPPAPRLKLPSWFGDSISFESMERLLKTKPEFRGFDARIALSREGSYRNGDALAFTYTSSRRAYYVVIYRDPMGEYSVILPSSSRDPSMLTSGKSYAFPEAPGDRLIVRPPAGPQDLVLICSQKPLRLEEMVNANPEALRNLLSIETTTYQVLK